MSTDYNLGDKVILEGLEGYWEIVEITARSDSTKTYVLRIKAGPKYKDTDIDCVEFLCCEKTLKKLTSRGFACDIH
jgi:hypothetical protein